MKSVKLVLSFGMVLAIATSIQVNGMLVNPNLGKEVNKALTPKQFELIRTIRESCDREIGSLKKDIEKVKVRIGTSADRKAKLVSEFEKDIEVQENIKARLDNIFWDNRPYADNAIIQAGSVYYGSR